jgi:hypothetical protein
VIDQMMEIFCIIIMIFCSVSALALMVIIIISFIMEVLMKKE